MNRIVRAWDRSVRRPRYEGPDALTIEDEKVVLEGEMAARKKPETGPILDNSALKADPKLERSKVIVALPRGQFRTFIRAANSGPISLALEIRTMTYATLKRLGVKRDLDMAVSGIPKGSDQIDLGSLKTWLDKIQPGQRRAVNQVLQIDATVCARGK